MRFASDNKGLASYVRHPYRRRFSSARKNVSLCMSPFAVYHSSIQTQCMHRGLAWRGGKLRTCLEPYAYCLGLIGRPMCTAVLIDPADISTIQRLYRACMWEE